MKKGEVKNCNSNENEKTLIACILETNPLLDETTTLLGITNKLNFTKSKENLEEIKTEEIQWQLNQVC